MLIFLLVSFVVLSAIFFNHLPMRYPSKRRQKSKILQGMPSHLIVGVLAFVIYIGVAVI